MKEVKSITDHTVGISANDNGGYGVYLMMVRKIV